MAWSWLRGLEAGRGGHCGTMDRAREIFFFFFLVGWGSGLRAPHSIHVFLAMKAWRSGLRKPHACVLCPLGGQRHAPGARPECFWVPPLKPTIPEPVSQAPLCGTGPGPQWLPPAHRVKQEGRVWQPGMRGWGCWPGLPAAMQRSPGTAAVIG